MSVLVSEMTGYSSETSTGGMSDSILVRSFFFVGAAPTAHLMDSSSSCGRIPDQTRSCGVPLTLDTASGAGRRWWSRIAQEISNVHDLKTRLIEQTVNSQGALETEWPTVLDKTQRRRLGVGIVPALSPWLGIGARLAFPLVHVCPDRMAVRAMKLGINIY